MLEPDRQSPTYYEQSARLDFDRAHMKAFFREIFSWLNRSSNDLLPYDEIRRALPVKGQHDLGVKVIPLDHIVGSVNRNNDFDRAFLPRVSNIRSRWVNIDKARMQSINLPAIEVIKVGDIYFVKDGNHRVSVAREMGQLYIDAYVSEISVPVKITPDSDIEDVILEQLQFHQNTNIKNVVRESDIRFTQVGMYPQLEDHISVHRWYMGEKFDQPISEEEAVRSWYFKVYLPIVQIIRNRKILDDFPGHTEADLYFWIITHQYFLAEHKHGYVPFEQAAIHFANKYSHRPLRRIKYLLRKFSRKINSLFEKKPNW